MILRYWDPGIREEVRLTGRLESEVRIGDGIFQDRKVEDGSSRFSLDLGWRGLIEGTTKTEIWIRRQLRIMRIWILILISILIKTKSNQDEGIIFLSFNSINQRFGDMEIHRTEYYKESCNVIV
ncbi:hypothetical protein Bca4012_073663 [Brassica carinata]